MKIVAMIPARSGSKGLLNKNIRKLNNYPLLSYPIKLAKKSRYISHIYINSDDQKYLKIGNCYGAKKFKRKKNLSKDKTSMKEVILDFANSDEIP